MTYLEVCRHHILKTRPDLTDEKEIERAALEFFNSDPNGALDHVFAVADELQPRHIVTGEVKLAPVGVIGEVWRFECGPDGATFKDGERVLYTGKSAEVSFVYFSEGWALTLIAPVRRA